MVLRWKVLLLALGIPFGACADAGTVTTPNAAPPVPVIERVTQQPIDAQTPVLPVKFVVTPTPTETVADTLDRLRALDVVAVGELIVARPSNAGNCYGPCPEDIAAATEEAAKRLTRLVDVAESAVLEVDPTACSPSAVAGHLDVLSGLAIVEVEGLITSEPANNPSCYNLPCGADLAVAEALNCEREAKLAAISDAIAEAFSVPAAPASPAQIAANLDSLAGLDIVEIGDLIRTAPESACNAYVCPPDDQFTATNAQRLADLVEIAASVVEGPAVEGACETEVVDANLDALAGLAIVEVHGLVEVVAAANCAYYVPCPEDIAAAEAATCEKAQALARLVEAADL
jgi:hypothetical protein